MTGTNENKNMRSQGSFSKKSPHRDKDSSHINISQVMQAQSPVSPLRKRATRADIVFNQEIEKKMLYIQELIDN